MGKKGEVDTDGKKRRVSCHHCGNLRKKMNFCIECPYVYCQRCTLKMYEQHGEQVFEKGCPVVF